MVLLNIHEQIMQSQEAEDGWKGGWMEVGRQRGVWELGRA